MSIGLLRLCRRFGDIGSPIKVYFLNWLLFDTNGQTPAQAPTPSPARSRITRLFSMSMRIKVIKLTYWQI